MPVGLALMMCPVWRLWGWEGGLREEWVGGGGGTWEYGQQNLPKPNDLRAGNGWLLKRKY